MFTFNPKKFAALRHCYKWAVFVFVWAICPALLLAQSPVIDLGEDGLVGEGETVMLHATMILPPGILPPGGSGLISSSEDYTLQWYKRTIDEVVYPTEPFATATIATGTTEATQIDSPIEESTYYKVVLTDGGGISCEDEVLKIAIRLSKLLFHDSHTIYYDPGVPPINTVPGDAPTPYVAESGVLPGAFHWLRQIDPLPTIEKPVCYTRNTAFKVSAYVKMDGLEQSNINLENIKLKATASATGFEAAIAPNTNSLMAISGGYLFEVTTASAPFPDVIGVYNMGMEWEYSENGGDDWSNLASTENAVYTTLNDPIMDDDAGQYLFHTTLDIACQEAAGLNEVESTINAIYAKIATRNVQTFGGELLDYWGPNAQNNNLVAQTNTTQGMLFHKSGRCHAWARFWVDILGSHGIGSVSLIETQRILNYDVPPLTTEAGDLIVNAVNAFNAVSTNDIVDYTVINASMFMVKNWGIVQNGLYRGISNNPENYDDLLAPGTNAALNGVAGQHNDNPLSLFYNHALVRVEFITDIGGGNTVITYKYYDPSYGTGPFIGSSDDDAFSQWETNSIAGLGAFIEYGSPINTTLWVEKIQDSTTDLQHQEITY